MRSEERGRAAQAVVVQVLLKVVLRSCMSPPPAWLGLECAVGQGLGGYMQITARQKSLPTLALASFHCFGALVAGLSIVAGT